MFAGVVSVQFATSVANGAFAFDGLAPGTYQIDTVQAGLVVAPGSCDLDERDILTDHRQIVALAGDSGVTVRVYPMAVAALRLVDATTRAPVLHATVVPIASDAAPWPGSGLPTAGNRVFVSGGRTVDLQPDHLASGVVALPYLARAWPVPDALMATLSVSAPGYRDVRVAIPLAAAGTGDLSPVTVELAPVRPTGKVRFKFVDRDGQPIGPVGVGAYLHKADGTEAVPVYLRFDPQGSTGSVAGPVGEWTLTTDSRGAYGRTEGRSVIIEQAPVVIDGTQDLETRVRLNDRCAAIVLDVVDDWGDAIDDVGILTQAGHHPIAPRFVYRAGSKGLLISGIFLEPPGLGQRLRRVLFWDVAEPLTVEAYRHGYRPARQFLTPEPGSVSLVRVTMVADPDCRWDAWERVFENAPGDVLPARRR
jgi:hypothetical protein